MVKSKFIRAADLKGRAGVVLTIAHVTEELMGRGGKQEVKCFLWFTEDIRGLQLNKSRVAILEMAYGPESDLWTGRKVRLSFDPTVMFGGQAVGGVRLETPPGIVYAQAPATGAWGAAPSGQGQASAPPAPSPSAGPPGWVQLPNGQWVQTATGETTAPPAAAGPPKTISQRVAEAEAGFPGEDPEFGHAEIPF